MNLHREEIGPVDEQRRTYVRGEEGGLVSAAHCGDGPVG